MSKRNGLFTVLAIGACWLAAAREAVPDSPTCTAHTGACCPWCLNDYCRKPPVPVPPTPCQWCPGLYCRKPPPPVPPTPCHWCPNNYCAKPGIAPPRNCEPWYRCVPTRPNFP